MVAGLRSMGSNKRCMQSASPTLFIPLPKGVAEGRGMSLHPLVSSSPGFPAPLLSRRSCFRGAVSSTPYPAHGSGGAVSGA